MENTSKNTRNPINASNISINQEHSLDHNGVPHTVEGGVATEPRRSDGIFSLPMEIWREIFKYLTEREVRTVLSVNKQVRESGLAAAKSNFVVCINWAEDYKPSEHEKVINHRKYVLERLEFAQKNNLKIKIISQKLEPIQRLVELMNWQNEGLSKYFYENVEEFSFSGFWFKYAKAEVFQEVMGFLNKCPNLLRLRIEDVTYPYTSDSINIAVDLSQVVFKNLRELSLSKIDGRVQVQLSGNFENVEKITVDEIASTGVLDLTKCTFKKLKEIVFKESRCKVFEKVRWPRTMESNEPSKMVNVEKITFNSVNSITFNQWDIFPNLKELYFGKVDGPVEFSGNIKALEKLTFWEIGYSKQVKISGNLENLQELTFGSIDPNAIIDLTQASLPSIEEITCGKLGGKLMFPQGEMRKLRRLEFKEVNNQDGTELDLSSCIVPELAEFVVEKISYHAKIKIRLPSNLKKTEKLTFKEIEMHATLEAEGNLINELKEINFEKIGYHSHLKISGQWDCVQKINFGKIDSSAVIDLNEAHMPAIEEFACRADAMKFPERGMPQVKKLVFTDVGNKSVVTVSEEVFPNLEELSVNTISDDSQLKISGKFLKLKKIYTSLIYNGSTLDLSEADLPAIEVLYLYSVRGKVEFPQKEMPQLRELTFGEILCQSSGPMDLNKCVCPNLQKLSIGTVRPEKKVFLPKDLSELEELSLGDMGCDVDLSDHNLIKLKKLSLGVVSEEAKIKMPRKLDSLEEFSVGCLHKPMDMRHCVLKNLKKLTVKYNIHNLWLPHNLDSLEIFHIEDASAYTLKQLKIEQVDISSYRMPKLRELSIGNDWEKIVFPSNLSAVKELTLGRSDYTVRALPKWCEKIMPGLEKLSIETLYKGIDLPLNLGNLLEFSLETVFWGPYDLSKHNLTGLKKFHVKEGAVILPKKLSNLEELSLMTSHVETPVDLSQCWMPKVKVLSMNEFIHYKFPACLSALEKFSLARIDKSVDFQPYGMPNLKEFWIEWVSGDPWEKNEVISVWIPQHWRNLEKLSIENFGISNNPIDLSKCVPPSLKELSLGPVYQEIKLPEKCKEPSINLKVERIALKGVITYVQTPALEEEDPVFEMLPEPPGPVLPPKPVLPPEPVQNVWLDGNVNMSGYLVYLSIGAGVLATVALFLSERK